MAAHQNLERRKVACLRRRDKEPITDLDYHCVAAVTKHGCRRARTHKPDA